MRIHSPTTFSAAELLEEYFDLFSLGPKPEKWGKLTVTKNAPRYYRFRRIAALFRAFELEPDFVNFPTGRFLHDREPLSYEFLRLQITQHLHDQPAANAIRFNSSDAVLIFRKFFRLYSEVCQLQRFNAGWLEAGSDAAKYLIAATEAVVTSLDPAPLQVVTSTLSRLIDPRQRIFSLQELIDNYDFPDVDLFDIDTDWM